MRIAFRLPLQSLMSQVSTLTPERSGEGKIRKKKNLGYMCFALTSVLGETTTVQNEQTQHNALRGVEEITVTERNKRRSTHENLEVWGLFAPHFRYVRRTVHFFLALLFNRKGDNESLCMALIHRKKRKQQANKKTFFINQLILHSSFLNRKDCNL